MPDNAMLLIAVGECLFVWQPVMQTASDACLESTSPFSSKKMPATVGAVSASSGRSFGSIMGLGHPAL